MQLQRGTPPEPNVDLAITNVTLIDAKHGASATDALGQRSADCKDPGGVRYSLSVDPNDRCQRQMGAIEMGKTADLVLFSADPLADINNTRRIDAVIARGRIVRDNRLVN